MKILQVISGLGNGGAEKFVVELSNELSRNHSVSLCSFKPIREGMQFPKRLQAEVPLISLEKKKGMDLSIYRKLYRLIKKEKPDVIHFHLDATLKYLLPFVILFSKIRFIYTLHSDVNAEKRKVFRQLSYIKGLTQKLKLVCIAANIRDDFKKEFPGFQFELVENGIAPLGVTAKVGEVCKEIEQLKPTIQTLVLLSVARLDLNKNQGLLMEAIKELKNPDVICLIIGEDPSRDQAYQRKLNSLKGDNVFLLGTKHNVADYLVASDAFVLSSLNEGMPISVLEAMSYGLPVIATPAGGLTGMIKDNVNGFIAEDFSKPAFVKALQSYMNLEKHQKENIAAENRKVFSEKYSIGVCAAAYLTLYTNTTK